MRLLDRNVVRIWEKDFDYVQRGERVRVIEGLAEAYIAHAADETLVNSAEFSGLLADDNYQAQPNLSSQYDLLELMPNRDGPLPQDRTHDFKLDGYHVGMEFRF